MKIIETSYRIKTSYRINAMVRTLIVRVYGWGIQVIVLDKTDGASKSILSTRYFSITKCFPTIESNIQRGMRYFHAPKSAIEEAFANYSNMK